MTSAFDSAINEMIAELRTQYENLAQLQETSQQISGSATSPRHQLTATVDSRGALTSIRFNGNAYRKMAPEELANMIVETVRAAQRDARRTTFQNVGDLGVTEAAFDALADGTMDWRSAFGDTFTLPQPLLDLLATTPEDLLAARGYANGQYHGTDGHAAQPRTDDGGPRP